MENFAVIIVSPLTNPVYTKGKECQCERCGVPAWVSDTSCDAIKEKAAPSAKMKFICFDCIRSFIKENEGEEVNFMRPTRAQLEEIKSIIRR